ncbi:MAG: endonuclease/exonuclease/phosphatase family protein, partial [Prevotella sp.]|nr:endonuclease/exonuclease/phosphatase family protein [Prevotella sp.]
MKRLFFLTSMFLFVTLTMSAQKKYAVYGVGFYNQENLFDTCHDEGKNDYDFLPNGSYKWDKLKYTHKLHNMARALADMGTDMLPNGCAVIGLSEVENSRALDDLVAEPELAARGYRYAHIEGPDRRGVDCAMLYNPALFTLRDVKLVPYV